MVNFAPRARIAGAGELARILIVFKEISGNLDRDGASRSGEFCPDA